MSLFASLQSQGGCSSFRISFRHLYCYSILNKQNHFLRGKCQSHRNHIVCFSKRGCPCDLHSFLPSSFSNWPSSFHAMGSTAELSGKVVFFSDEKEAPPVDMFPFHSERILTILWQELLVWLKKNLV